MHKRRPTGNLILAVNVVMTLLTLGLVIAVGTPETGPLEKAVAALAIVAVVVAAGPVRRIGAAS